MAEDQNLNLTASFKATADTSAFDKAAASIDALASKLSKLEQLQSSIARAQQVAGRASEKISEEGLKGAAAKAVLREAAAEINKELGLSGRTAKQLADAKIDPKTISNAAKTLKGFGEITETLGKLSGQVSEKALEPLRARLERDRGVLSRALAGNLPGKGAKFITGQEIPAGLTAKQAAALESKKAPSIATSDAEAVARSKTIRSRASAKNKEVAAAAEKVEQAVVQTIQAAADSLKETASAASQTNRARARIRQATGTSRIIEDALLLGAGPIGGGAGRRPGAGAGSGAGAGGPRARRPFGYDDATNRATDSLNREARAAKETAVAMKGLAEAKKEVVSGEKQVASSTGRVIDQLMKEMKAAPKAAAALHQMLRQMEAANNPRYARGFAANNQAINTMSGSADRARRSFVGMAGAQDSFLGQVKQVAVMATSFSVLQGVAGKLQEGFHHLTGGIIGFNQVLERTAVGFRRLFINQEQQVEASRAFGDTGLEVEYLALGYKSADEAAQGMVGTIREFANVTPFRFEELAQATLRMRAFGFSLDEVLYKSEDTESGFDGAVVAIGDAVSALGGGALEFQRITYALGQMKQAGRVYQNDMMQLANAGIGGYKYIADSLRKEITKGNTGRREDVKAGYEEMYDELQSNAIETVRRLTTNGQISGEAAARAIILGLKTDFGGGMKDFSQTFVGAWTTLADTSQSLVARAFEPFYKQFVKRLYDLGQFFQTDAADEIAKSFQPLVEKLTAQIFGFASTAGTLIQNLISDVSGAFSQVNEATASLGFKGKDVFNTLRDGIGVVSGLLKNDMTRSLITTTTAFAGLVSFARSNPMLMAITAILFALGLLRQAYLQNFGGFRTAVDDLAESLTPVIAAIRDDLIPIVLEVGTAIGSVALATFVELFKLLAPIIVAVANAIKLALEVIRPFAGLIGLVISALVLRFAFGKVVSGFMAITRSVETLTNRIIRLGQAHDRLKRMQQTGLVPFSGGGATNQLMAGNKRTGRMLGNAGGALMGAGLVADLAGAGDVGGMLFAAGAIAQVGATIKSAFPATTLGTIATKIKDFGGGLGKVFPLLGTVGTALAGFGGKLVGVGISIATALGPIGLLLIALAGLIALIVGFNNGKGNKPQPGSEADRYLRSQYESTGGGYQVGAYGYSRETQIEGVKRETAAVSNLRVEYSKLPGPSASWGAMRSKEIDEAIKKRKEENLQMQLLIQKEKQAAAAAAARQKAQERYNRLLQIANRKLQEGSDLLRELAEGALENMLNPEMDRINPYTGLAQAGLELEEVVKTAEMMQFTQFENAQGITRSFDEYRDILNSIAPITERDVYNGQLSLQAVTSRLKIEKERKAQLDLIKKNQEAEYDLSLAQLRMYDESIDPLERAVAMRKAQSKYEEDIRDVRMSGLDLVVDEASASNRMVAAEARIAKKLKDIQKGQDLILNEMARRFEQYNNEVADIMSKPNFSQAERTEALKNALTSLTRDLEDNFGVTEVQLQNQYDRMNAQMDLARQATAVNFGEFMRELANPTIPPITWGGRLRDMFKNGVFDPLIAYLESEYARIAALIAKINALAANGIKTPTTPTPGGGGGGGGGQTVADRQRVIGQLGARLVEAIQAKVNQGLQPNANVIRGIQAGIQMLSTLLNNEEAFKAKAAAIRALFPKLKSGGIASGGFPHIVGEAGPELFIPEKSGLVLNNSISTRLMDMLAGRPSMQPSYVVNINNPTVRSDADIRKLAEQITKAQVSMYRSQGGRLL